VSHPGPDRAPSDLHSDIDPVVENQGSVGSG